MIAGKLAATLPLDAVSPSMFYRAESFSLLALVAAAFRGFAGAFGGFVLAAAFAFEGSFQSSCLFRSNCLRLSPPLWRLLR